MKTSDPALYRELSKPHDSVAALDEALSLFREGVAELRKLHRVPDVILITSANAITSKPDPNQTQLPGVPPEPIREGQFIGISVMGDHVGAIPLIAYALGKEKAEFNRDIAEIQKGATR